MLLLGFLAWGVEVEGYGTYRFVVLGVQNIEGGPNPRQRKQSTTRVLRRSSKCVVRAHSLLGQRGDSSSRVPFEGFDTKAIAIGQGSN